MHLTKYPTFLQTLSQLIKKLIILLLNEVLYFHFLSDLSNTKTTILVSVQVHSARDQYLNATCRDISTNIHYSFEEWLDTNTLTNLFANLVPPESFQPITESLSSRIGNIILL